MLLSTVFVLVVTQSSSEIPEGLRNNPVLSFAGVSLMLLQLLGGAHVVVYFRNDDEILLDQRDSSGWFSLPVVPIGYVVGVGSSSLFSMT